MTISYERKTTVKLARDTDFAELLMKRDELTRTTTYTEHSGGTIVIAPTVTQAIPLGGVTTAELVYLEFDATINVYINGSATALPAVVTSGDEPQMWLESMAVTSLSIENPHASNNATVYFMLAGV